jgi:hypothetical protein
MKKVVETVAMDLSYFLLVTSYVVLVLLHCESTVTSLLPVLDNILRDENLLRSAKVLF